MQRIKDFWSASFHSNPRAFVLEMVSFVFTVTASGYLAIHANDPDMRWVYPGFLLGAVTSFYSSYLRGIVWTMMLTSYFSVVNVFGFGRAMLWW